MARSLALGLTLGAIAWSAVLVLTPLALSRGIEPTRHASVALYAAAGHICHQRPERSFAIGGVQQPVCARCFGLYVSGALGALLGWSVVRSRVGVKDRTLLMLSAAPTAITFGLEFLGFAYPSNAVRAIAALPLGLAAGWVFVRALRDEGT